ncbi:MAG: hypothetical protein LBS70_01965 [Candidatus Accumulibacter sp.]|jgi:hypothetical protein|nr:hypothetical protein [Accumulibacter sp.]
MLEMMPTSGSVVNEYNDYFSGNDPGFRAEPAMAAFGRFRRASAWRYPISPFSLLPSPSPSRPANPLIEKTFQSPSIAALIFG